MADTGLFSRLQRLFSTDVIIRNVGGNQIKVIDSNTIQTSGELQTNSLIDRYNRIYSTNPTSLYGLDSKLTENATSNELAMMSCMTWITYEELSAILGKDDAGL